MECRMEGRIGCRTLLRMVWKANVQCAVNGRMKYRMECKTEGRMERRMECKMERGMKQKMGKE